VATKTFDLLVSGFIGPSSFLVLIDFLFQAITPITKRKLHAVVFNETNFFSGITENYTNKKNTSTCNVYSY
jgi:hypothetical protein